MATSGSNSVAVTSYDTLKISWSLDSQSTTNNTSTITFKAQLVASSYGKISSTASKAYTATVAGTSYSGTNTVGISNNSTLTLWSKTITLSHSSDGSLSTTFSFSQTFDITFSGSKVGTYSVSCTVNPTTIARASSITSASAVTLGNACSIKWTPASSSYAYKIKFVVGSGSYTTGYISPGTTSAYTYTGYTMAIATWAPYITSATSATCTVTLYTYSSSSSSSSLGSSSATFTVTVPSTVVPTVSIGSVAEGNSAVGIGVYVQNMSTVKVTFTGTMAYSSSLKSYTVTVGSLSYSGSSLTSGSSVTVTSGTLTSSGSVSITVTVTDARGRSGTASQTITVYAYSTPSITTFKAQRVDSSGNADDNGTRVKITYAYSVSSLNSKNTCSMTIKYKESTASSYSSTITSSSSLSANTSTTPSTTFDDQKGWDFQITIVDIFNTATVVSSVGTGIVPLSIYWNGTGVGVGKVAETGSLFDVALKQHITASSYQLEILNSESSGATGMWAKSWSGRQVACEVGTGGDNMGVYDQNLGAWMIYTTSSANLYVGANTNYGNVYVGNTSTPLYLRGSNISVSGSISGSLLVGLSSSTSWNYMRVQNSYGGMSLSAYTDGSCGLYNSTLSEWFCRYYAPSDTNRFGNGNRATTIYGSTVTCSSTLTVSGNITSGSSSATGSQRVYVTNSAASVSLSVNSSGQGGIYDWQHSKWIIYSNSSGSVTTNSAVATVSELTSDEEPSTLATPTFRDPGHEMLANLTAHTYEADGRKHIGLAVAELEESMQAVGMNPDVYDITEHWTDEDGNEVGAIRYGELIPILISEIQSLNARIDTLEEGESDETDE